MPTQVFSAQSAAGVTASLLLQIEAVPAEGSEGSLQKQY